MEEKGPAKKVVAEMVDSFRLSHPEGKSDRDYEVIFRSAFSHLREQANAHLDQKDIVRGPTDNPHGLPRPHFVFDKARLFIMYMLKLELEPFATRIDPSDIAKNDQKSCYEAILSNLIRFESLLEAFVHYKGGMHVSHTMSQPIPDHELSTLRLEISGGQEIKGDMAPAKQDEDCLSLARSLATFLDAWVKFFDNFSLSPLDARSVIEQWSNIEMIEKIEDSLVLLANPIVPNGNEDFEPDSDDEAEVGGEIMIKFAEAAIPFIKLSRIYIKKLRQSIVSQPLIFDPPSILMRDDRLESLLNCLGKSDISHSLEKLTGILEWRLPSLLEVERTIVEPFRSFNRCSKMWKTYLDLLMESDNPGIKRNSVMDTRRWINSWTKLFLIAARKAMDVTGDGRRENAWPSDIEVEDIREEDYP
ncbi:hypothetical protein Pst134EA_032843 [Puccinia striiformis f. sp. tritici]|uniref:uncharacterized protein n=1 Tax=Puccinia striiformis f. sp. tritici TaxID=168172 RepID=UPI002007E2F8|nr:uncharacterized protein Pst134EA_032843 [Puccinia striiformis f. sp. tritici]KAH9441580.1 hypothetical protein Pst134EA_032843 [Puccinia striiformis f. sp. tritici]